MTLLVQETQYNLLAFVMIQEKPMKKAILGEKLACHITKTNLLYEREYIMSSACENNGFGPNETMQKAQVKACKD